MIRLADSSDLEALAGLEILLFPSNSLNEKSLADEMTASVIIVWGKPAVAYIVARFGPELIDVLRVGVLPTYQRQGIARSMMRTLLARAYLPLMLCVRDDNTPAMSLYKTLGFEIIAMLPQVSALIMFHPTSAST